MKQSALKIIATLCFLATLTPCFAFARIQINEKMVIAIPFEFSMSGKTFPAGEYSVRRISPTSTSLLVQSDDGEDSAIILAHAALGGKNMQPRLVFNIYGRRHFLSQVWMPGEGAGRHLPQSREERTLMREVATGDDRQPRQTTLLARRR